MSQQLISLSGDLKRLRDEGYGLEVKTSHLLVRDVPFLNNKKEVCLGILVMPLTLAGDQTTAPDTHQAYFIGEKPCNEDGSPIDKIINSSTQADFGNGVVIDHSFSAKPKSNDGRYLDYYEKVTAYIAMLSGPAQAINPLVTSKTYAVVESTDSDSPFKYLDTSTSRAQIGAVSKKLEVKKVAVIGAGGTGGYVIDLIVKVPIKEIHIFDGDLFHQHNAFRAPGCASLEDLKEKLPKAKYYEEKYSKMRHGVHGHVQYVDESNISQLKEMDFVFICIDSGPSKKQIIEGLESFGISFVDVGMGIFLVDNQLGGVIRTTTSTPAMRSHVHEKNRIPFSANDENEYNKNIQIGELNALNASIAVIKWKKLLGFYLDLEEEHSSTFTIDGNFLSNEDKKDA